MSVIIKKDEKIASVIDELNNNYTVDDFIKKFQESHKKDWDKLVKNYQKHESKTKEGKHHPMPTPIQYLKNALNVWHKKYK